MITYICDKCKKEFKQPLDQILLDESSLDLCAPCRKLIHEDIKAYKKKKYADIKKKL